MYTICHQMLTIASASGAPPVFPKPSCGTYDVPHTLHSRSLALAAPGPSCLQLPHSDIRVGFLAFNPRLHGRQEEFLYRGLGKV